MGEKIFKCPNDLNVTVKQDGGEVKLNEDCCTGMIILLKNDGNMATSFYGYHNPQIIKTLLKAQKKYFKSLKKRLKLESIEDKILLNKEEIPEDKKWDESKELKDDKKKGISEKELKSGNVLEEKGKTSTSTKQTSTSKKSSLNKKSPKKTVSKNK